MVSKVTSLTGNGLKDWIIQRVTAIYMAAYALFLFGFVLTTSPLDYAQWRGLFNGACFQVASGGAMIAFLLHAWIGIWTVSTDYIKPMWLSLSVQFFVILLLLGQLIWGSMIIWGY